MNMKRMMIWGMVFSVVICFDAFGMNSTTNNKHIKQEESRGSSLVDSFKRKQGETYNVSDAWYRWKSEKNLQDSCDDTEKYACEFIDKSFKQIEVLYRFYNIVEKESRGDSFSALNTINENVATSFGCDPLEWAVIAEDNCRPDLYFVGLCCTEQLCEDLGVKSGLPVLFISEEVLKLTPDRLLFAVIAHEYGHFIKKHLP